MQYDKNIIPLDNNHRGAHTDAYKVWVLEGLQKHLKKEENDKVNTEILDMVLDMITRALNENTRLPYTDGKEALKNYSWETGW